MRTGMNVGIMVAVAMLVGAAQTAAGQAYEWRPGEVSQARTAL